MPATLFGKAYIDTMFMPKAGGFGYVVHARCSVSSYPEARILRSENHETLTDFIFQDILCRWGAIQTIVTDNGKPFIAALNSLAKRYGIFFFFFFCQHFITRPYLIHESRTYGKAYK
jgi:hypothetical protein